MTLVLRAEPPRVRLDADLSVTLELTHPEAWQVAIPERLDDRFEGFRLEGAFEGETLTADGIRRRVWRLRARPLPAAERYRIAPFAVTARDPARGAQGEFWFATRPLLFEAQSLLAPDEERPAGIETDLRPFWVRPSARRLATWAGWGAAAAALLALLVWTAGRLRRRIRLARMAPRERALLELRELLARDLPGKGRTKEFYLALTLVVRRYIERRYALRAPEQTTEEFLREAALHPAFATGTLDRLRGFLDAADLVKFAGATADAERIGDSVAGARAYLENEPRSSEDGAHRERP